MIIVNARAIIERENDGVLEILIQRRTRKGQECYELPGGQVNEFESLIETLKREVKEETGLSVTELIHDDDFKSIRVDGSVFDVECIRPYCAYQTLKGPVDSMGVYFRCHATGNMVERGDDTDEIQWVSIEKLREILGEKSFSDIDQSAVLFYLENMKKSLGD